MNGFRKYFGFFIVLTGTALAAQLMTVEANAIEKEMFEDSYTLFMDSGNKAEFEFEKIKPTSLGLAKIDSFADISTRMEKAGYEVLHEVNNISCFAPFNLSCSHLSSGHSLYKFNESPQKLTTVTYRFKLTLNGCQPSVNQVFQVELEKEK